MWSKPLVHFVDEVVLEDGKTLVKNISLDMLAGLTETMPVDTSRAVSNVIVSIDEPDYTADDEKYIGRAGARAAGVSVINTIDGMDRIPTVYIQNNLHYVPYLENGHSKQAPNGVFLPTFLAVTAFYR